MAQTSIHPTLHSDLITSLSFSHHGNRLATSSLDHSVRVTSLSPSTGLWDANPSEFKAHDAPVLKVVWASPEFGPILASGGVDGLVKVWSEEDAPRQSSLGGGGGGGGGAGKRWVQKVALSDARGTIRDIEFAPPEFGIKLAAVSSDSHLRVWECLDPVALTDWSLIEDIDLTVLTLAPSSSSSLGIAGALGVGAGAAMLGGEVGVNGPGIGGAAAGPGPKSFEMGGGPGASPGRVPLAGSSLASSSAGSAASSFEGRKAGTVESEGGWALSWCKEAWWGERLAVSSGSSGIVRVRSFPPPSLPPPFPLPPHEPELTPLPPQTPALPPPRPRPLVQLPQPPPHPPLPLLLPTRPRLLPLLGPRLRPLLPAPRRRLPRRSCARLEALSPRARWPPGWC